MTLSRQEPISEYKDKDYASRLYPTICTVFNDERVRKAERGLFKLQATFCNLRLGKAKAMQKQPIIRTGIQ
jgi:hypothetical protein